MLKMREFHTRNDGICTNNDGFYTETMDSAGTAFCSSSALSV